MQRKGNAIHRESQVKNQISVGIDMGGSLWATAVHDWEAGKMSYYGLKDKVDRSKEDRVFDLVSNLHKSGKRIASDTLRQRPRIHTFFACGILSANVWNVRGRWKVGNDGLPAAGVKCKKMSLKEQKKMFLVGKQITPMVTWVRGIVLQI